MENREGSGEVDVGRLAGLLAPMLDRVPPEQPHLDAAAWHALATRAVRERLGPLLYVALQRAGRTEVPAAVQTLLAQAHCRAAAAALYQQQELAAILRACAAAQIPCIVLKGSALAVTLYPDPALRPCGDIDLLFHAADIGRVLDLLRCRGFAMPDAESLQRGAAGSIGEYHLTRQGARPAIIEPHWRLTNNPYYGRRLTTAWFWSQTTTTRIGHEAATVLAPHAQFLHLAAHYYLHHGGEQLLWLFDLALLLHQHAHRWDWEQLAKIARRLGILLCVDAAIDAVQQRWGSGEGMRARPALAQQKPDWAERLEWRLLRAPESALWAPWRALHGGTRQTLPHRLAGLVAPSPAVLAHHYGLPAGAYTRRDLWAAHRRRYARLPRRIWQAGRELSEIILPWGRGS